MTPSTTINHKMPKRRRLAIRPRSVTGLLLASFTLVALPMLAATLVSLTYVDRLSDQTQHLVLSGVQVTRTSKRLDTIITSMERSTRQYKILGDPRLASRFAEHKAAFDDTLATLQSLHVKSMSPWNLDQLQQQAAAIASAVERGPQAIDSELELFESMHNEAALITEQGHIFINAELQQLQAIAHDTRLFLLLCLIMLVPGAILLSLIFTFVISRPVRQLTRAINQLGTGNLDAPITIAAPSAEFDALGAQLDWMRRRLATLENERNQFLRHMSHELKTPLASIREGSELLSDGTIGPLQPKQAEVADIIQHNSTELLTLIENLLDFSAWRLQQVKLEYSRFEFGELLEAVMRRQQLSIESKHLHVIRPERPVALTADRERLHLILDNLLTNAVKFSPEQGTIRIRAEQGPRSVTMSVCDQGPGIAAHERARIFEAFYQSTPAAGDAAVRGTGIGLSVVSACVRAHDGHIDVTAAPSGGTCFQVTLPDPGGRVHVD